MNNHLLKAYEDLLTLDYREPVSRRTTFIELLVEHDQTQNPVTRSVLRGIIKQRVEDDDFKYCGRKREIG